MAQPGKHDVVIAGAGASGRMLANRLPASANTLIYMRVSPTNYDRWCDRDNRVWAGVAAFVHARSQSIHRPTGASRVKANKGTTVGPSTLKARELEALPVYDASVLPDGGSSNIMSTVRMSAKRGARFMN